jgi:uncharacterized Zn ribbon protein
MKVISLKNPYINGYADKDDPVAKQYLEDCQQVYELFKNGNLYVRFRDGDRKGSIAIIKPDPQYTTKPPQIIHKSLFWNNNGFDVTCMLFGICHWNDRKNKVKTNIPNHDIEVLLDYDGPTVWEKFDTKVAKIKALASTVQYDIDGNQLQIGDKVLYMNLRYGAGGTLQHGTIKEFKAMVDSKNTTITVIVKNDDADEVSEIRYPSSMIYKKPL